MDISINKSENPNIPIGCVVMAAGNSARFCGNKLLTQVSGKTLIERTLMAIPRETLASVVVVTQYDEVEAFAAKYGFPAIRNDHPEWGISYTIRLGTEALMDSCRAILYQVSDQPYLSKSSVEGLIRHYMNHPDNIVALSHEGVRGNPVIFPKKFFPELCALKGDVGGAAVIRRYPDALLLYEAGSKELIDVDTQESLKELSAVQ